jgi:predicted nucleotidyltransferase
MARSLDDQGQLMHDVEAVVTTLSRDTAVDAVYLLGSAASGRMRPDSDLDIAVVPAGGREFTAMDQGRLAAAISLELGRVVDLGVLSSANLVYARQAILTGRRIYARDPKRTDLLAAALLGMYERFNLDRREVRDAYTA